MLTADHEEMTIDVEEVTLNADHTAALKTISQGQLAQRYTGPRFAAAAEDLRALQLARITRDGAVRPPARATFDENTTRRVRAFHWPPRATSATASAPRAKTSTNACAASRRATNCERRTKAGQ